MVKISIFPGISVRDWCIFWKIYGYIFSRAQWNRQTKKGCNETNLVFKIEFFKGRTSLTRNIITQNMSIHVFSSSKKSQKMNCISFQDTYFIYDIKNIGLYLFSWKTCCRLLTKICKTCEKLSWIYIGATKLKHEARDF